MPSELVKRLRCIDTGVTIWNEAISDAANAHERSEADKGRLRELLLKSRDMLKHTACRDDDATKCPACSLESRIDAALSSPTEPVARQPAGFVSEPDEPTEEMIMAGLTVIHSSENVWDDAANIYKAMKRARIKNMAIDVEKIYNDVLQNKQQYPYEHKDGLQAVARAAYEEAARICEAASNIGPGAKIDKRIKRCELDIRNLAESKP